MKKPMLFKVLCTGLMELYAGIFENSKIMPANLLSMAAL